MVVLALNVGSSSIKGALFEIFYGNPSRELARRSVERSGDDDLKGALRDLVGALTKDAGSAATIEAVGHRVVHGGERFVTPILVTAENLASLEELEALAPLHNGPSLAGVREARTLFGAEVPEIAVFDTAFHASMPERARHYAISHELAARHRIRRFGFHGLSYESIVAGFAGAAGVPGERARIVALHLGSGCSAAAIRDGRSIDTTMGLTPLEGLVMGTRSGDVDPSVVGLLSRLENVTIETVEEWLNRRSGLLGLSGLSADMRVLLEREADHAGARLAIEVFCYRARKVVSAYLGALGGADALVFTGGIGEHCPPIRERVCEGLEAFGIVLDAGRNTKAVSGSARISANAAAIAIYVIPSDEERMIALAAARVVGAAP